MAAIYNPVPFKELAEFLSGLGFQPMPAAGSRQEVVYQFRHLRDDQLSVRVYTSCLPDGQLVRGRGQDAIRISLVADSAQAGCVGLASATRVNRAGTTEAIFSRIHTRVREMYRLANRMLLAPRCRCGAPTYPDSGKCVLRRHCGHAKAKVA